MHVDIVTIFPTMVEATLGAGIVGRAISRGTLGVTVHDLRSYTSDRHRVVDDVPYGGGPGMVLKPEPLLRALEQIEQSRGPTWVVLMSPQGQAFTQQVARRLVTHGNLALLCGRYEGVDERVRASVDEELSIGDYILTGGELAALVVVDAVARLLPGVVGDKQSVVDESFSRGLLDFPQYTRPASLGGTFVHRRGGAGTLDVPEVLTSGHHAAIRRWRKRQAVARTFDRRPDLLANATLDEEEREVLRELVAERDKGE